MLGVLSYLLCQDRADRVAVALVREVTLLRVVLLEPSEIQEWTKKYEERKIVERFR